MDRQTLESVYAAAPARALKRALDEPVLQGEALQFVIEHVEELPVELTLQALTKPQRDDEDARLEPFVRRLAELLPDAGMHLELEAHRLAATLDPVAWADLTRRLRNRLPAWRWYRFVDLVRGSPVFNALNVVPKNVPRDSFCSSVEEQRTEPLVVPLLESPDDDLAARRYLLSLPFAVVTDVHRRVPKLITQDELISLAMSRTAVKNENWKPPLPPCLAPQAIERMRYCEDEEAVELMAWLRALPDHPADLFEIALERFKKAPNTHEWHVEIGRQLATGAAWKKRGRAVFELFVELKGYPTVLVIASLNASRPSSDDESKRRRAAVLGGMHDAAASVLVAHAYTAMSAADWESAKRLLSALACLDPGSFISGPVHNLRSTGALPDEIDRLVTACETLFKRSGGRYPTDTAIQDAFAELKGGA